MKSPRCWRITAPHKILLLLIVVIVLAGRASAQAVRFDQDATTVSSACASGKQCQVLSLPGTTVNFCSGQNAGTVNTAGKIVTWVSGGLFSTSWTGQISINGTSQQIQFVSSTTSLTLVASAGTLTGVTYSSLSACLASPATTYTDFTAGTSCATTAQLTPQTGGACLSTADNQGNFGGWFLPGQYSYYLRVPATAGGGTYGPFPVNVGAAEGCVLGSTCDANYQTLTAACTAAGTGTLYGTRIWAGLTTQTLGCNIVGLANFIMRPASGQVVTLTGSFDGSLTQHFDFSTSGTFSLASARVPVLYPQWFGALCGGVDDTTAVQNTLNAALAGRKIEFVCQSLISSTVYVPEVGQGVVLQFQPFPQYGVNNNAGATLKAKAGSASFQMLKIYAASVDLENISLDGNNGTATSGFVFPNAANGIARNIQTDNMSGDGISLNVNGGGTTNSSTSISLSQVNPTITVTTALLQGQTIGSGAPGANHITLEYGTANQDNFTLGSVAGTTPATVSLIGTAQHAHSGTYNVRINGNDNLMRFYNPRPNGSGYPATCTAGTGIAGTAAGVGWGINMYEDPFNDMNAIEFHSINSTANGCGGIVVAGFANRIYGGDFAGDDGPAVQIGDSAGHDSNSNGRLAVRTTVYPLGDLEENGANTRGVNVSCSSLGSVQISPNTTEQIFAYSTCGLDFDANWGATNSAGGNTGQFSVWNYNSTLVLNPNSGFGNGGSFEVWSAPDRQEVTISTCTNANPAVCTVPANYTPQSNTSFTLSGFTGSWVSLNGVLATTRTSSTTFSVPIDSTGFGAVTGTPVLSGALIGGLNMNNGKWVITPAIDTVTLPFFMDDGAGHGFKFARNGTDNTIQGESAGSICIGAAGNAVTCGGSFSLTEYDDGAVGVNVNVHPEAGKVGIPGGLASKALCFKASDGTTIGRCSTAVDSSGSCTCN